ncbi:MAG: 4-hydroxy-tetrahydrodipicolinate synthase [Candidatus Melainabacteria bacterium]|nr:MAG: 4-hydroxy-tetrahydrodipicolinate synthase [Candidatus Melainabacteria bacterium]
MVTPFDKNSKIDFKACERMVEHLIATGSSAIVISGTTGESPTLEDGEKQELLKCAISAAARRAKIIMGTGSNNTKKSVQASREAETVGADGLLAVVPYYNKPSQAGMVAHFKEIAKSSSLPIILYNIPGRTGVNMAVDTTIELAEACGNIVGLKDSTADLVQAAEIAGRAPKHFRLYSGDDVLTLPFLSIGACGVVSVASHLIGKQIGAMIEAYLKGNVQLARELHDRYLVLFKGLFIAPNPTCVKYALAKEKLCEAYLRLPLVELDAKQKSTLDGILNSALADTASRPKQASFV